MNNEYWPIDALTIIKKVSNSLYKVTWKRLFIEQISVVIEFPASRSYFDESRSSLFE